MLIRHFESKTNFVRKVVDVTINSEEHFAIVVFVESRAVLKIVKKKKLKLFGAEVEVSKLEYDTTSNKWRSTNWKKNCWDIVNKLETTVITGIHKYKKELENNGLAGLKNLLKRELESLTSTEVHIAVIGMSGSGKSSFINSIRGLKPGDTGAAEVGVNETTTTCNPYSHPENNTFIVWDLPGVGTSNFPQEEYLQKVGYDNYDFFIIISRERCTEIDLWLAQEIRKRKKHCFYVRSYIDVTIQNNARDHSKTHNEDILLQSITTKIKEEFQSKDINDLKVFLISNWQLDKYDFGRLNNELLSSSDGLKKDFLALSLSAVTREVMGEKKRVLEGRISTIALSIASTSTKSEQREIFRKEINLYMKQFNIDEKTLSENKEILFLTDDDLEDFRVVFDEHKQESGMTIQTPTTSMNKVSLWIRFIDCLHWSREKTTLYRFSEAALKNNLEMLYQKTKTFYDNAKVNSLIKSVST